MNSSRFFRVNRLLKTENRVRLLIAYLKKQIICPGLPPYIIVSGTSKCNLKCPMCTRAIWKFNNKDIEFDLFCKIIDIGMPYFEMIILNGAGEPLMNPKLFDMIRYIKSKGIYSGFSTNATLLKNEKIEQVFASGLDDIIIAFDGATAETYEKYRKGAKFEITRNNILKFLQRKNQLNSSLSVTLQMVRLPDNNNQINKFIKMWSVKGVNSIRVKEDEVHVDDICFNKRKRYDQRQYPCHYLWQGPPFIQENGDVYPCCHMWRSEPLGNVKDMSLNRLWNNRKMQELRQSHGTGNLPQECISCQARVPRLPVIIGSFLINIYMVRQLIPLIEKAALFYNIPFFRK